ncbi:MAG TPA: hypothetical protein VEB40_09965 [Flavipsychrobacter sp.]|nr:hypothetical protein [Flavipsychrobacter sp.]
MSLYSVTQRFIYNLKAKNRHGIHSPFVYNLLDKCLLVNTHIPLIERLKSYFGTDNLLQISDLSTLTDNNILFIPFIHKTPGATKNWNQLRADRRVLLSIDLFDIGLLITRPEFKEKQHFVLKTK